MHKSENFTLTSGPGLIYSHKRRCRSPPGLSRTATVQQIFSPSVQAGRPASPGALHQPPCLPGSGCRCQPGSRSLGIAGDTDAARAVTTAVGTAGLRAPPLPWRRERAQWRRAGRTPVGGDGAVEACGEGTGACGRRPLTRWAEARWLCRREGSRAPQADAGP